MDKIQTISEIFGKSRSVEIIRQAYLINICVEVPLSEARLATIGVSFKLCIKKQLVIPVLLASFEAMHAQETSALGLGMAAIGRPQYINIRQEESEFSSLSVFREKGKKTLQEAYRLGIRYFDTAPGYGMAERLLIEWLQEVNDPDIRVATKWGYTYVANFDPKATQHEIKEHSLAKLNEQWEQSKKLLPWLSIYQIHSATFDSGVLENRAVHERLAAIRDEHGLEIGLTASGEQQAEIVEKALELKVEGKTLFDAFQLSFNLFDQSIGALAERLHASGKKLVIKEAMANGRVFPNSDFPHYKRHYAVLNRLAQKYSTDLDAIALRFCADSLKPFKVLSGAANPQHIKANLEADRFSLTGDEIAEMKALAVEPKAYWNERKQLDWN